MKPNHQHDPYWMPQVTVPVRRVGLDWEFYYGGDEPVKEGTLGELQIMTAAITDDSFLRMVTQETLVKVLDEDAVLYAALSDRSQGGTRIEPQKWPKVRHEDVPLGTRRFAAVKIGPSRVVAPKAGDAAAAQMGPPEPGGACGCACAAWRSPSSSAAR